MDPLGKSVGFSPHVFFPFQTKTTTETKRNAPREGFLDRFFGSSKSWSQNPTATSAGVSAFRRKNGNGTTSMNGENMGHLDSRYVYINPICSMYGVYIYIYLNGWTLFLCMLVLWGVLLPPNNHGFTGKWVENLQYESFLSFSVPLNHDYGRRSTNFWMHHYIPGTQMGPLVLLGVGLVLLGVGLE